MSVIQLRNLIRAWHNRHLPLLLQLETFGLKALRQDGMTCLDFILRGLEDSVDSFIAVLPCVALIPYETLRGLPCRLGGLIDVIYNILTEWHGGRGLSTAMFTTVRGNGRGGRGGAETPRSAPGGGGGGGRVGSRSTTPLVTLARTVASLVYV